MLTFFTVIGNLFFLLFGISFPFNTLSEYRRSPRHPRSALVGSCIMLLFVLLALLNWILVLTHILTIKNPTTISMAFLDLTLLVNGWTSPSEKWVKRRNNRKTFFAMIGFSLILAAVCVIILAQV